MDCLDDNTVEVNSTDINLVTIGGNANYNSYWLDPVTNPTRMLKIPWTGMVYRSKDGGTTWTDTTSACAQYVLDMIQPLLNRLLIYTCSNVDLFN